MRDINKMHASFNEDKVVIKTAVSKLLMNNDTLRSVVWENSPLLDSC